MGERPAQPSDIQVIRPGEEIPFNTGLFLAGPTPRSPDVPSWRPGAIRLLAQTWLGPGPLVVYNPEPLGPPEDLDEQYSWETRARAAATVIAFWIPRDMKTMPGMTTNVEFGYDVAMDRQVVLGCPPDCPDARRNRYLIHLAQHHGVPVRVTLADTMATALHLLAP